MVDNAAVRAKRAEDAKKYYKELSDIAFQYEVWNATVDQRLEELEKREKAAVELLKELRENIGEAAEGAKELKEIGLELRGFHVKMTAEVADLGGRVQALVNVLRRLEERVGVLEG
jgi:hypothetical protein